MSLYQEGFTQNREISWLRYNERILDEALDVSVPLFERLGYAKIFASNLEEFFKVRVGSLLGEEELGYDGVDARSGMSATEQLDAIHGLIPNMMYKKDRAIRQIEFELANEGLVRVRPNELTEKEQFEVARYFKIKLRWEFTARLIKSKNIWKHIDEEKSYIIARLTGEKGNKFGLIDMPSYMSKVFVLQDGVKIGEPVRYILCEDIIMSNVDAVFAPFVANEAHVFDITRNAQVMLESSKDQLADMKEIIRQRRTADPDRLIVDSNLSQEMYEFFEKGLNLGERQIYVSPYVSLDYLSELNKHIPDWLAEKICFKNITPFDQTRLGHGNMIDRLEKEEILSCYPYDSMKPFLELLRESATDPRVKEIRISIYRLSSHPMIVSYLMQAARNGKKVRVLMELRARFDEESNIKWAETLISNGCKLYYGLEGLKCHCKICQIVLKKGDKERYITQIGTGNYNESTAKLYTDFSFITYDQRIGRAASEFFTDLIHGKTGNYDHILTSPLNMQKQVIKLIKREAKKGPAGRIFLKVNGVTDPKIIEALMEASCKGCKIRMIVRGICCILPGIELCTENIEIVNVVGRLLEHSRVYIFGKDDDEVMYISSADFMTRNMIRRVELACPIYNTELRKRIRAIMYLNYADNVKGRILNSEGIYEKKKDSDGRIDSQNLLIKSN